TTRTRPFIVLIVPRKRRYGQFPWARQAPRTRRVPVVTGWAMPLSVTRAVTRPGGVTSKAGFQALVPSGATGWPAGVAGSIVEVGATTTNGTWWCRASTARP